MRGAPFRRRPTGRTWAAGTSQREWKIKEQRASTHLPLGVSMLHVMHDVGDGRLLVRFKGSLDERATDSVLSAVPPKPVADPEMLDRGSNNSSLHCDLARLSQDLETRHVRLRGLHPRSA